MATIKEMAQTYESEQTKNIADLEVVRTDLQVTEETFQDQDGKDFTINVTEVDGERYRVPVSVLKSLKAILESNPNLKTFKVTKTGEGLKTTYTVIPLG